MSSLEAHAALYEEFAAKGVKFRESPTDKPWGMREMLVEDPDGHILRIGAPLSD